MIALYHGTTLEVAAPLVKLGRKRVDFGQGFYLTKLKKQASLWAETIAERRMAGTPILSQFVIDSFLKFKGSAPVKPKGVRHA